MWQLNVCFPTCIRFYFVLYVLYHSFCTQDSLFYFPPHHFQGSKPGQTWTSTRCAQTSSTITHKGRNLSCLVEKNKTAWIHLCSGEPGFTGHTINVLYSQGKIPLTSWWPVTTPLKKKMASHGPGQCGEPRHWLRVCVYWDLCYQKHSVQSFANSWLPCVVLCCVIEWTINGWELLGSKPA